MTYRDENRRRWQTVAAGWEKHADDIRRDTMPVTSWMLDALEPQPGHQLLEIAAGIGDTGFLAAELIQPGGTLITSDLVPEMLTAAQRRAEKLGITNARFRQIDAEAIDQPAASLDGVLSRWGYMLMPDAEAALRDTRRVLRPGGRLALAVWGDPADNPWTVLPGKELIERGLVEPVPPGPGPVRLGARGHDRGEPRRGRLRRVRGRVAALHGPLPVRGSLVAAGERHLAARAGASEPCAGRRDRQSARRAGQTLDGRGRLARAPRQDMGGRGDRVTSAPYVLRQRRRPGPAEGQDGRHPRLRLAGPRPLTEPEGLRRRRRRRAPPRLVLGREGPVERPAGHRRRRRGLARRRRDGAAARREARPGLERADPRRHRARQDAALRPRLLRPLRRGRAAPRGRRRARRPQGPRPPRPPPVPRGQRRPRPRRRPPERLRQRARAHARVRQGHRLHARRRDRDHVQGRDRDRPVRRAGRALRRRLRAGAGRLRDARGGRLRPQARLLRVPARAQADRRPDVREGPQRHALQRVQHRRVRRLHARQADHLRRHAPGDEGRAGRDPVGRRSRASGSPRTGPGRRTSAACAPSRPTTRSSARARSCAR